MMSRFLGTRAAQAAFLSSKSLATRYSLLTSVRPSLTPPKLGWLPPARGFSTSEFNVSRKNNIRKKQARAWMDRHVNDQYVKKAKIQSYRSRAAFKLMEIDDKHKLLRSGMKAIDVGAAPGGWSQVLADRLDSKQGRGQVVAIDLLEMLDLEGVVAIQGDIEDEEV